MESCVIRVFPAPRLGGPARRRHVPAGTSSGGVFRCAATMAKVAALARLSSRDAVSLVRALRTEESALSTDRVLSDRRKIPRSGLVNPDVGENPTLS